MRTAKQKLAKIADGLWKEKCLEKWGDICIICGLPANTFHHFILKSRNGLMVYDIENGVPVCQKHHSILHGITRNPNDVYELVRIIREKRGKKWANYIDKKAKIHKGGFKTIK